MAGHDWCVVRLGVAGVVAGFEIDTSHFTGNYAPAVSIEATDCASDDPTVLDAASWTRILPATTLAGNSHHLLEIASGEAWSHLRLNIYPDGGKRLQRMVKARPSRHRALTHHASRPV